MASKKEQLDQKQARVLVVSFESPDRLRSLQDRLQIPFTCVLDQERAAYAAFGLGRAPITRTYFYPRAIWGYVKMIVGGDSPDLRRGQDRRQLGGDFVIDHRGEIALAHPERGPEDRVPVGALLAAVSAGIPE